MRNSAQVIASSIIRRADVADLSACAAIINDYIDETNWLPRMLNHDAIARLFDAGLLDTRIVFVALIDREVVGYASLNAADGFLPALYLHPKARQKGIGKGLLDAAKAACPTGFDLTVFEPNIKAYRFYLREHFVEIPSGRNEDTDEGVPTLLMRWNGKGESAQ